MKQIVLVLALSCLLIVSSGAESGKMELVGSVTDSNGTVLSVARVELGRDRYVALAIKEQGQDQDTSAVLLLREVEQARGYCADAVEGNRRPAPESFDIVGGFPGENEEMYFLVVNFEGHILPVIRIKKDGREGTFVLNRTNQQRINRLLKTAAR